MENPFLSIVIPCYNCASHIGNTLKSIINQQAKDFEVILINDGSSDNSLEIATNLLSSSNLNYQILSHENKGVSFTRNRGIDSANGKYIYFLDADDMIHDTFIEKIREACYMGSDCICFRFKANFISKIPSDQIKKSISGQEIIKKWCLNELNIHMCSVVFKKMTIQSNGIKFNTKHRYGEDHEFIMKVLAHSSLVYFLDDILFYYVYRENSAVNSYTSKRIDSILAANELYLFVNDIDENLKKYLSLYVVSKTIYNIESYVFLNSVTSPDVKNQLFDKIRYYSNSIGYHFYKEFNLFLNLLYNFKVFIIKQNPEFWIIIANLKKIYKIKMKRR